MPDCFIKHLKRVNLILLMNIQLMIALFVSRNLKKDQSSNVYQLVGISSIQIVVHNGLIAKKMNTYKNALNVTQN